MVNTERQTTKHTHTHQRTIYRHLSENRGSSPHRKSPEESNPLNLLHSRSNKIILLLKVTLLYPFFRSLFFFPDSSGAVLDDQSRPKKKKSFTCQKMVSIVLPRNPSLVSDDSSLGPRMVINSLKSTCPSPGKHT